MAAKTLGVTTSQMRMVAVHGGDAAGALHAGCAAALVLRPGMPADPLLDTPDIIGKGLREVAERIIEIERG
jgi:2-haloacid dehalogenase